MDMHGNAWTCTDIIRNTWKCMDMYKQVSKIVR